MDLPPGHNIPEPSTAPEEAPEAKLIRLHSLPPHGKEEPQALLVKSRVGESSDHGIPRRDIPRGHFVEQLPRGFQVTVLDVTPDENVPGHDIPLGNSLEQTARGGEIAKVGVSQEEVVRGEPVGGGARRGGEGVKLAEEREGAAGPKEVGEEVRFRPEDLAEAVVQSILEAASRAEADDLLFGIWWSGGELLQSWPGHAIACKLLGRSHDCGKRGCRKHGELGGDV